MPVTASEGWGVLHVFFHVHHGVLADPTHAAGDFAARVRAFDGGQDQQALAFSVLGQKADLGLMLLGPDLEALDGFCKELAASPFGQALSPAASYLSLTHQSEYTSTQEDERARLIAEDGLTEGSDGLAAALESFSERMATYREHRLHPRLPSSKVVCFYPMSKRRDPGQNWYALPFDERKQLMAGHARLGRTYRGRVLQLITASAGLDDWEWGVTLLSDDPATLHEIVYEMRFDEVSARYAEFGPFVVGLVMEPETLVRQLRVAPDRDAAPSPPSGPAPAAAGPDPGRS